MTVDVAALRALVDEGWLTVQQHPTSDLLIWNHTQKTQWERNWTPETLMCRGLITRPDGTVVARPFPKFFNLEEHVAAERAIPDEPFEVSEKMDGSLGILYWQDDGEPAIATRGSFTSDQAQGATKELRLTHGFSARHALEKSWTWLFEIIFPENRIVVDYGDRHELVLLAVIDTATGRDLPVPKMAGFTIAPRYDGITDVSTLKELASANREGYVVRFASGLRLKVKFAEYVRLHRLITGLNERSVWEHLASGQSLDTLIAGVPEEFEQWVRQVAARLTDEYGVIKGQCEKDYAGTRRTLAGYYQSCAHPPVLFKMLDGKPFDDLIWKAIKPAGGRVFKYVDEGVA